MLTAALLSREGSMGLFSRKSQHQAATAPATAPRCTVPDLEQYALAQGWQQLGGGTICPLPGPFDQFIHSLSLTIAHEGAAAEWQSDSGRFGVQQRTTYADAYTGQARGRQFSVANAFTSGLRGSPVSVALSSFPVMPETDITPQQYRGRLSIGHRAFQTGDPAFDRQFMVHSQDEATARQVLCPTVRSVIRQRDDWCLVMFGYELLTVGKGHYASVEEICARLALHQSLFDGLPPELRPDTSSMGPVTLGDGTTVTRAEDLPAAFERMNSDQQLASLMALKDRLGPQQYQAVAAQLIPYIRNSRKS
jgi:hypothetical protein